MFTSSILSSKKGLDTRVDDSYVRLSTPRIGPFSTPPSDKEEEKPAVGVPRVGMKTAYVMRRSPPVRRFKKTKSRAKDQMFSPVEKIPSMGAPPISPNQIYNFTGVRRSPGYMTSSTTLEVQANFYSTLADIASASGYQAVFDQYRFVGVEVWLFPRASVESTSSGAGLIGSAIDYDDSGVTTLANLPEYVTYMEGPGYYCMYRSYVPAAIITIDGVEADVVQEAWIDCTYGAVVHRGVKIAITATPAVQDYDLVARYHLQFRNVR